MFDELEKSFENLFGAGLSDDDIDNKSMSSSVDDHELAEMSDDEVIYLPSNYSL
ncbi:hypothetical protein [Photobacterium leiognathi]|uniref:hypothetical protein n=1 Tax=Photobacterium leiognathi TaxID=553611 RepID=UPI002980D459|nr:hypothetical protein [Photobacterium leiognathi]